MLDLARELSRWCAEEREFAVATVTGVSGSAPRGPGASMAVDADGEVLGSVSGGCVEAAVHALCQEATADGRPRRESFGYSEDDALAVGLSCGGTLEVLVQPVPRDSSLRDLLARAAEPGPGWALVRPLDGGPGALLVGEDGHHRGDLGQGPEEERLAVAEARARLAMGRTEVFRPLVGEAPTRDDGTEDDRARGERCAPGRALLVECRQAPPRMLVFGAIDFAAALTRAGAFLGYRVTVCDARPVFATPERFPEAEEVVVEWPHRYLERTPVDGRTVICVLTHDAKFDLPLLERALRLPVGYVGAMGSRRTHQERARRLRAAGVTEAELARLRSPIGLDLGARTPEETALSIAAQIVADRYGGSGLPLTGGGLPIHHASRRLDPVA
ncbi:XdhC/CoxI family protein [Streptomyces sp. NPDC005438]|uniref:XdhC family protein n=1 Tax=Streptomyces sp. NPDC005438 TaxID=3156880 RepID=UPI0033ADFC44